MSGRDAFIRARDYMLQHRLDYEEACKRANKVSPSVSGNWKLPTCGNFCRRIFNW